MFPERTAERLRRNDPAAGPAVGPAAGRPDGRRHGCVEFARECVLVRVCCIVMTGQASLQKEAMPGLPEQTSFLVCECACLANKRKQVLSFVCVVVVSCISVFSGSVYVSMPLALLAVASAQKRNV